MSYFNCFHRHVRMMECSRISISFLVVLEILLIGSSFSQDDEATCGFPGTPAYGFIKPNDVVYEEGDVVQYFCRVGYILIGSPINRCTESGSWTEDVPICDDSMTSLGAAHSSPTEPGHSAELAIDRNKETCSYMKPKKPRWWRVELGAVRKILSVAVTIISPGKYVKFTVFVVKTEGTDASYKRCASFTGRFGTQTIVLACAEGKGIEGEKVHVEDYTLTDDFEICEVEVQVEKDTGYDCGRPSRNLNSITFEPEGDRVEYGCVKGFELVGRDYRTCLSSGQWSGEPPVCQPIICDELDPLENGDITITQYNEGLPLEGSIAISECDEGFKLIGAFTRYCLKDGSWSDQPPQCRAIRCRIPDGKVLGGFYRLTNITNNMGDMAELICRRGSKLEGSDPFITCTEEGEWTKTKARCIPPKAAYYESAQAPRIAHYGGIIFGKVVAGLMIVIVVVGLFLYTLRRRNGDKPELPSRQFEPPVPPPRPPPRSKAGGFRTALMGLISRDVEDSKIHTRPSAKEDHIDKRKDDLLENSQSAVVQVEVLAEENSQEKTVPEEVHAESLEEDVSSVEDVPSTKEESTAEKPINAAEYAAINYDEKRRSRLLKEQDSFESNSTTGTSPVPDKEHESSRSPTPPVRSKNIGSKSKDSELSPPTTKRTRANRKREEADEPKTKEIEPPPEKETESSEAQKDTDAGLPSRRRRARAEEPAPVAEEKPVLRRIRRN